MKITRVRFLSLIAAAATLGLAAARPSAAAPPDAPHPIVTMVTTKGVIKMKLFPEDAPLTVANFVKQVKKGFYNGLAFHRVVPGFIIQGGDPQSGKIPAGLKGEALSQYIEENHIGAHDAGYTIKNENNRILKHQVGAVAMANRGRDTADVQFYIVITNPAPSLDEKYEDGVNKYTLFGQVIDGQSVAEKIEVGDKMTKVTVTTPAAAPTKTAKAKK